ncbi:unnamed protein product [Clonostachys solani]|uniref:Uncharacterized protein n=1 Tax=Clonostachys solani TaxID=160281 RepID=A0A9N9Z803_9HYPO|nr:unnamed protein product [Clonostachys solani]
MEKAKEQVNRTVGGQSDNDQFTSGYQHPGQEQSKPGLERDLEPKPIKSHLPADEGLSMYKPTGKLGGKRAVITGGVINNASVDAYIGPPTHIDYAATKGAVVALTRALSNHLVSKGMRVNAVAPGPVWTPLIASSMGKESQASLKEWTPMGRIGQPSEVATCFVFLASHESSFMSGQTLHPNGGMMVNG